MEPKPILELYTVLVFIFEILVVFSVQCKSSLLTWCFVVCICSSTDSQLKLWNINKPHCLRTFKGHINEKNFVGLASNGDYVACGELLASDLLISSHHVLGVGW